MTTGRNSWLATSKSSSAWWEPRTSVPASTIRRATAKSNVGTARSNASAFASFAQTRSEKARKRITAFVEHDNTVRLRAHATLGYLTPADKLAGLDAVIFAERDHTLEEARQQARLAAREVAG